MQPKAIETKTMHAHFCDGEWIIQTANPYFTRAYVKVEHIKTRRMSYATGKMTTRHECRVYFKIRLGYGRMVEISDFMCFYCTPNKAVRQVMKLFSTEEAGYKLVESDLYHKLCQANKAGTYEALVAGGNDTRLERCYAYIKLLDLDLAA